MSGKNPYADFETLETQTRIPGSGLTFILKESKKNARVPGETLEERIETLQEHIDNLLAEGVMFLTFVLSPTLTPQGQGCLHQFW